MITDEQVEAAVIAYFKMQEACGYSTDERKLHLKAMRAALEAADRAAWRPIEEAPTLERVIVAGFHPRSRTCAAYWWYHEDATDARGTPIDHPEALKFRPLPTPPEAT